MGGCWEDAERDFLLRAVAVLEHPRLLIRLSALAGRPLEGAIRVLPARQRELVARAVQRALERSLALAVGSLGTPGAPAASLAGAEAAARRRGRGHRLAATLAGAGAGLFGWPGLLVELPLTTSLLLRSIASIAGDFGEDLDDPAVRLECLGVFSHGAAGPADDTAESAYLATRAVLAGAIRQAAEFVARSGARELEQAIGRRSAPALVRLLAQIAGRFDVVVTEKMLAQGLPVLGAVGGAALNAAFCGHFNEVARHHFGLRRLERTHGEEEVRAAYRAALRAAAPRGRAAGSSR